MKQASPPTIPAAEPESPEAAFEQLRLSFHWRLRSEQVRLATLSGTLGSAGIEPALVFGDIGMFAHRLRGAALVFDFGEIGAAAQALEAAAAVAVLDGHCDRSDPAVVSLMQVLAMKLAEATGRGALPVSANVR